MTVHHLNFEQICVQLLNFPSASLLLLRQCTEHCSNLVDSLVLTRPESRESEENDINICQRIFDQTICQRKCQSTCMIPGYYWMVCIWSGKAHGIWQTHHMPKDDKNDEHLMIPKMFFSDFFKLP